MRLKLFRITALLVAGVGAATGAFSIDNAVAATGDLTAIPGSFSASTDTDLGEFSSSNMTVEIVLAPSNETQLDELLNGVYNPADANYQQWLATGEFNSRFAPSTAQVASEPVSTTTATHGERITSQMPRKYSCPRT
jgi:hypothetical protein